MRSFPDPPATLTGALERAAAHFPDRGVAVSSGHGTSWERRTYPEVLAMSRRGAARWNALGIAEGDRVLICLSTSWVWLEAWLGALVSGALPVAVAPGAALGSAAAHVGRVDALAGRLGVRFALIGGAVRREAERGGARSVSAVALTPEEFAATTPGRSVWPRPEPENVAFLQLTSGSTGLPRAVMIPHRAVLHNNLASDLAIGAPHGAPVHTWADAMVSWLPLHHDMGLVGCLFLSILCGFDLWLLQPTTFLARPRQWLEQLGRHGVTFAPAPNFGYQLCVERLVADLGEGLDLSGWRAAMTGAEVVRSETVDSFCQAFAPRGFDRRSFRPCYGLAEATLTVTLDRAGRGPRTRRVPEGTDDRRPMEEVVCVGHPVADTEVRIAAPDGSSLPPSTIGEVRVRGPGVFAGYYDDAEATAESLVDGWLATGDLGFLTDGELYVTGRLKDVLIVGGHNLMPHEFEWLAEEVTGGGGALRSGAFSVARGPRGEEPVLVVETAERDPACLEKLARQIRQRVGRALSLPLADLVFVRRGRIPKTTSGKVQRQTLRQMYLDGELAAVSEAGPTDRDGDR